MPSTRLSTAVEKAAQHGGNPLGLVPTSQQCSFAVTREEYENADNVGWTLVVDWESADDDNMVKEPMSNITCRWKDLAEQQGSQLDFEFMNNASGNQNPLRSYGEGNLQRLTSFSRNTTRRSSFRHYKREASFYLGPRFMFSLVRSWGRCFFKWAAWKEWRRSVCHGRVLAEYGDINQEVLLSGNGPIVPR